MEIVPFYLCLDSDLEATAKKVSFFETAVAAVAAVTAVAAVSVSAVTAVTVAATVAVAASGRSLEKTQQIVAS